jgi:IS5 family transposase
MFIILPEGYDIVDVILGEPGSTSDISQFRKAQEKFCERQKFRRDTGYQGEAQIATPHKKLKKKELTSQQKEENTGFAQKPIYVEHTVRVIKIFSMSQQRFRLRTSKYQQVMRMICGLCRLRIRSLVLSNQQSLHFVKP